MTNLRMRAVVPAIAVVALLVAGCGSDDSGSTGAAAEAASAGADATDAPAAGSTFTAQDALDVVDAIGLAYNTYDVDLFNSVTAQDFHFVDERGDTDRATQTSYFPALREGGQQGEPTADPVILSEDPFVVAVDALITSDFYPPEGRVGTSTYTLVDDNGELKVQEHRWTGDLL